jgi:hypothetical protein
MGIYHLTEDEFMIGDYPNLPEADNQLISQQPLVLSGSSDNTQDPFLDALRPLLDPDMQQTFAQQSLLDPDMQQTFAQQSLLDPDMQQTFAQQPLLDPQHPLFDPDMQQTFAQQPLDRQQPFSQAYYSQFGYPYGGSAHPEHLGYYRPAPLLGNPFVKLANLWRSEPAYRVFFIALATVLISGFICMFLVSNLFKQPSSQTLTADKTTEMSNSTPMNFPTPMVTPTPTPLPTPTIEPTTPPAPPPSQLTVNITGIPSVAINNTTQAVSVTTNEPGVSVTLYVTYSSASPSSFTGTSETTNRNGQVTLSWPVKIHSSKRTSSVTAHVTVFAEDINGQTAASQTVTVQIFAF